ncbi:MAG TPA: HlyD family type I secretion periplasmic adaptor subunit [Reyranellaceae bacterium]|nr:HlyD family type I secretion periplasmic adaptor subunit [Reyranellaceae bacterium]
MSMLGRLIGRRGDDYEEDRPIRPGGGGQLAVDRRAGGAPAAQRPGGPAMASGGRQSAHPLVAALAEGGMAPYRAKFEDFLPQHEELSQRRHSPFATLTIYAIGAFVVVMLLWMAFASLDSVATAPGVVRPAGKVKLVNHTEGGRVTRLLVQEGSEVREGDIMIELESELIEQEVVKNRALSLALSAEVARLEAETTGRSPQFPPEVMADSSIFNNAMSLWRARQAEITSRRAAADAQIEQSRNQLNAYATQVKALSEQVPLLERRERDLGTLAEQGYYSKIQHLEARRQMIEAQGRYAQLQSQLKQAEQSLAESTQRRQIIDQEWTSANYKRLADAKAERDRASAALAQQQNIRRNLAIRAPIDGIVNGLKVTGPGQSIRPGDPVLGLVPAADARRVEVEARVSNNDIGMIKLDQRVVVKVQTYDWIRYGSLEGKVTLISADASTANDPSAASGSMNNPAAAAANAQPYFVVMVSLEKDYLGNDPKRNRVLPGMTATADFNIGERTILAYFTDRLFRGVKESMQER